MRDAAAKPWRGGEAFIGESMRFVFVLNMFEELSGVTGTGLGLPLIAGVNLPCCIRGLTPPISILLGSRATLEVRDNEDIKQQE